MKKKSKALQSLLLSLLIAISLVGCSSTSAPNTNAQTSDVVVAETEIVEPVIQTEPEVSPTDEPEETEVEPEETESEPEDTKVEPKEEVEPEIESENESETKPEEVVEQEPITTPIANPEPIVAATPISIQAVVRDNNWAIGDELNASDFTITVNMSDGSIVVNPNGWVAYPMTLSADSNAVTVSYNNLLTTVNVSAQAPVINEPTPLSVNSAAPPVSPQTEMDIYNWAINNYGWIYYEQDLGSLGIYQSICKNNFEVFCGYSPYFSDWYVNICEYNDNVLLNRHAELVKEYYEGCTTDLTFLYNFIMTH